MKTSHAHKSISLSVVLVYLPASNDQCIIFHQDGFQLSTWFEGCKWSSDLGWRHQSSEVMVQLSAMAMKAVSPVVHTFVVRSHIQMAWHGVIHSGVLLPWDTWSSRSNKDRDNIDLLPMGWLNERGCIIDWSDGVTPQCNT